MKNKIIMLIFAVFFGLSAAFGVYYYIQKLESTYTSSENFVSVAVANQKISSRQVITDQMVSYIKIPSNYVNRDVLGKPHDIVGKITRTDIYPGEQILKSKLIEYGDVQEGLSMIVENGRRAMTIAVSDVTGLAGMIKPGDRVDILGTMKVDNNDITSTLVQDIKVLAVNRVLSQQKEAQPVGTVTLSVNPFEAQHIALGAEKGTLQLLLRTPSDSQKVVLPSTGSGDLIR